MEMPPLAELLGINPRRPLDDDEPEGHMESDRDFALNNLDVCVKFLEGVLANKIQNKKEEV